MKVIKTEVFTFDELSDDAKEKAREWYRRVSENDTHTQDEICSSFFALFKAANIKLHDYSIGAYSHSYMRFDMEEVGNLTKKRAIAWLENNLFDKLRITAHEFNKKKKDYMSYGDSYRIGKVKPCPLTGVCYDDDFIDDLKSSVKSGMTLKDSFTALADKATKMIEASIEWENKDEAIEENIRANEYEFTVDGKRFR